MNKKFKLSATVLALLTFTLMLFYQNCAQQSDDLGGGTSIDDPVVTPTNPYPTECINRGNNKFNLKIENIGQNAVVTVDVNARSTTSNMPQLAVVPPGTCPGNTPTGCEATTPAYKNLYGPWVRIDCPCMRAPTHNIYWTPAINGYQSAYNPTVSGNPPTDGFDLRAFHGAVISVDGEIFDTLEFYVKQNAPGPFSRSGRSITGNFATCDTIDVN